MATKNTYLDLINECDNFPYPSTPEHTSLVSSLWRFIHSTSTLGYITPQVAVALQSLPAHLSTHLLIDPSKCTVALTATTLPSRSASLAAITSYLRHQKAFKTLSSWRDEQYPIYSPSHILYATIERAAAPLFGFVAYCVYLIATTCVEVNGKKELKVWVPRRSRSKQTWPGMLDVTVAGAMSVGEETWDCVIREAEEEASFNPGLVKELARSCGTVMHFGISDGSLERGGGDEGLLQPECGFLFELELEEGVLPVPRDGEVEEFYCWTVEEVKEALMRGEYKTNCAAVMLDWLVRHEKLGDKVEEHVQIQQRMRRKLEFPLM